MSARGVERKSARPSMSRLSHWPMAKMMVVWRMAANMSSRPSPNLSRSLMLWPANHDAMNMVEAMWIALLTGVEVSGSEVLMMSSSTYF